MTYTPGSNTIAYYPLTSTSKLNDVGGKGYNLTNNTGAVFGVKYGVDCAYCSNHYMDKTGNILTTNPDSFTVSIWCYFDQQQKAYGGLWLFGESGGQRCTAAGCETYGDLRVGNGIYYAYVNGFPINSWHNVVSTYTRGTNTIYIDGEYNTSFSVTYDQMTDNGSYIGYGGTTAGGGMYGCLSEAIIENKARTQAEVTSYFNSTKGNYGYFVPDYLHWDTQGPCPDGYHIPTKTDWENVVNAGISLGAWSMSSQAVSIGFMEKILAPLCGFVRYDNTRMNMTSGYFRTSTATDNGDAYGLHFTATKVEMSTYTRSSGLHIRPFKNNPSIPDNTWDTIYQGDGKAGIFHNTSLGLISISSDGVTWYTIADKNLGATVAGTSGISSYGNKFQWGNNYGFPYSTASTSITSAKDASAYGPGNYYSYNIFNKESPWDSSDNRNLRGGVTDERPLPPYEGNELCFTANTAGSTVKLRKVGSPTAVNIEYSTDGYAWTDYTFGDTITLSGVGDKIYFRNKSETETRFSTTSTDYYPFTMTGSISASGDVNYLLCKNSTDTVSNGCFYRLFVGCLSLTTPPILPATTLATGCYNEMFIHSGIISVPVLPATVVAVDCYYNMFKNCVSLEELPALPAVELKTNCYYGMFYGCSNIKLSTTKTGEYVKEYRIPNEGTGITASGALTAMFSQTGGTFKSTPNINTTYYTSNKVVPEPGPTPPTPTTLNKYITKLYHLGKEYIFDERVSTTGINVSPTSINLTKLNETAQITASVIPTNADDKKIIYTSSAPSIVSVSSTGLVKALGEGNATITVKSNEGGFSKSVSVVSSFETPIDIASYTKGNENSFTSYTGTGGFYVYKDSSTYKVFTSEYDSGSYVVSQYSISSSGTATRTKATGLHYTTLGNGGIFIGNNGTKLFRAALNSSGTYTIIESYNMSSAYSLGLTKIAYKQLSGYLFRTIQFSEDGTKMIAADTNSKKVIVYTLSTPWDISTLTYSNQSSAFTNIYSAWISRDGSKLIVCENNSTGLFKQYSLSATRNVSSRTYEKEITTAGFGVGTGGNYISFNNDESKFRIWYPMQNNANNVITEYSK